MATNSAYAQLVLELINRYRLDPAGEYDRLINSNGQAVQSNIQSALNYFGVDLEALEDQLDDASPVAPLAWNANLAAAALTHSELMIEYDQQSHRVQNSNGNYVEPGLGDRISDAGYTGWSNLAENIYAYAKDPLHSHAGFVIDWGFDAGDNSGNFQSNGDGIQDPPGHRINILSANYTEIGISFVAENNSSTDVGPFVTTQNFGNRFSYDPQVLGVVINDQDGDAFYDIGEGLGGVTVTLTGSNGTYTTTTADAGGYQLEVPAGSYEIAFSGGGLGGIVTKSVSISGQNVKVDARADEAEGAVATPTSGNDDLMGTMGDDMISLLGGHDRYDGLAGNDTIYGNGGSDTIFGGDGSDFIHGGNGNNVIYGDGPPTAVSAESPGAAPAPLSEEVASDDITQMLIDAGLYGKDGLPSPHEDPVPLVEYFDPETFLI